MAERERRERPPDPAREHPLNAEFTNWQRNILQGMLIRAKVTGAPANTVADLKGFTLAKLDALRAQVEAL